MKKLYIVYFFLVSVLSFVFSQESGYTQVDVKLDGSKVSQAAADVGNIEVDFCSKLGEKSVSYDISPGEESKICYVLSNFSDQDVAVHVGFVDGTLTNDQWKNKACKDQGQVHDFGQYVKGYQDIIHIPARGQVQYFASMQFPKQFTGVHNGCLVYSLGGVEMGGKVNFTVLMRRAKFIEVKFEPGRDRSFEGRELFGIGVLVLVGIGGLLLIRKKTRK